MQGRRKTHTTTASRPITKRPPPEMPAAAQAIWTKTLKDVAAAGREISMLDFQAFVGFCLASATASQCAALIEKEGVVIAGRDEPKKHPACSIQNAALTQLRMLGNELGLTAASRGRLPAPVTQRLNDFDEF